MIRLPGDASPPPPEWTTYRTLDPIRAAALQAAVSTVPYLWGRGREDLDVEDVLELADRYQQYLTGEEADGQANR